MVGLRTHCSLDMHVYTRFLDASLCKRWFVSPPSSSCVPPIVLTTVAHQIQAKETAAVAALLWISSVRV